MEKLKCLSLPASMILLCLMEELCGGRGFISKNDERITVEQLDSICNLGGSVKITRDFAHEGKDFTTSISFIIADSGQIVYKYENNRGVDHMLIKVDENGNICGCAVEYQEALRNFANNWLMEMSDCVNLEHISALLTD